MKLVQKQLFKGSREFTLNDEVVNVRSKTLFSQQDFGVGLAIINPEPVTNGKYLEFRDRYKGDLLISLLINNPSPQAFNAFVATLKQKLNGAQDPSIQFKQGNSDAEEPDALSWNAHEEPEEFNDPAQSPEQNSFTPVNPQRIAEDMAMLKTYLVEADIKPFLDSLETLKANPADENAYNNMVAAFKQMGFQQGAVLSYATYLKILLSKTAWS